MSAPAASKTTDLIDEFDDEELDEGEGEPFGDKFNTFCTSCASLELLFTIVCRALIVVAKANNF